MLPSMHQRPCSRGLAFVFHILLLITPPCIAQDPLRPYPLADDYLRTTSILNHSKYVSSLDDSPWYLDNIPFVDFPEKSFQDVYYYRASVIKRHIKYAHEGHGWVFTEFIHPVAWASKLQTIPDSAGHHIVEGRWLRNPQYVKDLIALYTRGGAEALGGITYTHYIHRAIFEHAQATGDATFLTSQLNGLIKMYQLWNVQLNNDTGLYHRIPLSDAQEYSLPGYVTGGPNGGPVQVWNSFDNNYDIIWLGPETYRPNFNAYMVAAAQSIADIARLAGNDTLAQQWDSIASNLYNNMKALLWNEELKFWIDVVEGTNLQVLGRELIGYFPFRFGIGVEDEMAKGLEAGLNGDAFITSYGPTTLEQSNPYYTAFKNTTYCCIWQGQSWPFSTSVYLYTLAALARSNSTIATPAFFQAAFANYTSTNYKLDVPYTAESHYPTINEWSGDSTNHSEHYLHSTYLDNVFSNLIGILPTLDDRLVLSPLVPETWDYFAVENLPYHGTLLSLLWDRTGSHYASFPHTAGLSIYSNGTLIHTQPTLSPLNITLSPSSSAVQALAARPRYVNILSNPNSPHGLPNITADYRFSTNGDISPYNAWKLNDGLLWYDTTPDNFWTNNQSTTPFNTLSIALPRARTFSSVSLAIIDDTDRGGVIACPEAVRVSLPNGTMLAERNPWTECRPNALSTILFSSASPNPSNAITPATALEVETDALLIQLSNKIHYAIAVSEVQIWIEDTRGPRYEIEDGLLGTFIGGFEGRASGLNCSIEDGGVALGEGAWAEVAGVASALGEGEGAGRGDLTVIGKGPGALAVQMNFLGNVTVEFGGEVQNVSVEVEFLGGGNYVTLLWVEGRPWVDAIVVG